MKPRIIYTKTDEAPALATYSLLPVIQSYTKAAGISVETKDISLAARIIASFPDFLTEEQRLPDSLAELGEMVKLPDTNIIKLPNISASIPQLKAAVKELQEKGFNLPGYPDEPQNEKEKDIKNRYDRVKGSAVNPVLREGNSDRRAPKAVKKYAMKHPHSMGEWKSSSRTHVASMDRGDFYGSEKSLELAAPCDYRIELIEKNGASTVLKENAPILGGEIIDTAVMSRKALRSFLEKEIKDAKKQDVLFSIHLKATMMKVSDPIMFGHAVSVYFKDVFEEYAGLFAELGVDPNNGMGDLLHKLQTLPDAERSEVIAAIQAAYEEGPELAMVNSDLGITNLHVPSDVIIDASMPAAIRSSGKMWGPDGNLKDMKAVIPDRSYAGIYQETIDYCKKHGAFDPTKMGSVANVGLMAQKAEEYGSHDKTFQIPSEGTVRVVSGEGEVLLEQSVEEGDIFRMCQVKDAPIQDWIKLAVKRARATGVPAVFWLDENRAHDLALIKKVKTYLPESDTEGLDIRIMSPNEATRFSLERISQGKDTISVTGNVLRDFLTDLFPILEVGTSAKMLSIVPLMNGGGLFETGAGGSAPKHVQQFVQENHLRWDSLGEFLALAVSLEHLAATFDNPRAGVLAETLDTATGMVLENNKAPSRKAGELDNRGSHFYLSLYWAQALAGQNSDKDLKALFTPLAEELAGKEDLILKKLNDIQGKAVDLGGYYWPDQEKASSAMRPVAEFNKALELLK